MVDISRAAREYVRWEATNLPDDVTTMEVSIDGATWHPAEIVTINGKRYARVLFAGDLAADNPAGTVALQWVAGASNRYWPKLRLTDNPEVILRGGGVIDVV